MKQLISYISEHTLMPLGIALTVIGGGSFWVSTVSIVTAQHGETIQDIEKKQLEFNQSVQNIEKEIVKIRTTLELMRNEPKGTNKRNPRRPLPGLQDTAYTGL